MAPPRCGRLAIAGRSSTRGRQALCTYATQGRRVRRSWRTVIEVPRRPTSERDWPHMPYMPKARCVLLGAAACSYSMTRRPPRHAYCVWRPRCHTDAGRNKLLRLLARKRPGWLPVGASPTSPPLRENEVPDPADRQLNFHEVDHSALRRRRSPSCSWLCFRFHDTACA